MDNTRPIQEVLDEMIESSGHIVWRVTGTWACNGRAGAIDEIVIAQSAIEAIQRAWMTEDARDLRTINAEWLTPVECVKKASDLELDGEST